MSGSYIIVVRGAVPANLGRKVAEAHAQAVKCKPRPQTDDQKPA